MRQHYLERRLALSPEEIRSRSLAVQRRVIGSLSFATFENIAFYYPIRGEVEIWLLLQEFYKRNGGVFFPKVVEHNLELVRCHEGTSFIKGSYGIPEPPDVSSVSESILDCIFVPGVAFDRQGFRIGYGGGYYDAFLSRFPCLKIGLAYDFQLIDRLPVHEGDVPCDGVVSESEIIGRVL